MASPKRSVLFVCLGNICRSPIAEAVFNHIIKEKDQLDEWIVDSAATADYHIGKKPDARARKCMEKRGITMEHRARAVIDEDFTAFDYIFGMDEHNIRDLEEMAPKNKSSKILLLGDYDPQGQRIIRDPYYDSGPAGFEEVAEQCFRCCEAFLERMR